MTLFMVLRILFRFVKRSAVYSYEITECTTTQRIVLLTARPRRWVQQGCHVVVKWLLLLCRVVCKVVIVVVVVSLVSEVWCEPWSVQILSTPSVRHLDIWVMYRLAERTTQSDRYL